MLVVNIASYHLAGYDSKNADGFDVKREILDLTMGMAAEALMELKHRNVTIGVDDTQIGQNHNNWILPSIKIFYRWLLSEKISLEGHEIFVIPAKELHTVLSRHCGSNIQGAKSTILWEDEETRYFIPLHRSSDVLRLYEEPRDEMINQLEDVADIRVEQLVHLGALLFPGM
ncbi:hypothetical protein BC829DRAFT_20090 [Chytridium lagenaria]|nr:hypothetical protein BC829DRAFT_20090 [Chytridium lagenaria]